jgi:hypothetical protein
MPPPNMFINMLYGPSSENQNHKMPRMRCKLIGFIYFFIDFHKKNRCSDYGGINIKAFLWVKI